MTMLREAEDGVPFKITAEVPIGIGDHSVYFKSGCTMVDISFDQEQDKVPQYLQFDNFYTSKITVKVRGYFEDNTQAEWITVVKDYLLMPDPHTDLQSQNQFQINLSKQMTACARVILTVRLILKQPSPHWQSFTIKNIKFMPMPSPPSTSSNTKALEEAVPSRAAAEQELLSHGVVLNNLVSKFKQISSMRTKLDACDSTSEESQKFEVNGSYEINLLAYS